MNAQKILKAFRGKLVGNDMLKENVCEVVAKLPRDLQEYITEYCWFLGSLDDAWAYTFTGNDLADQHLIFISDDLLMQEKKQVLWSIAHEIGHVILKHRNSILVKQTKEEITGQEIEADQFAAEYI